MSGLAASASGVRVRFLIRSDAGLRTQEINP